jgi:hypothetical protein
MVRLERLGVATAAVATEPFVDEALEQARLLAMPDYRMVYIPHPVQLLTIDELHELADRAWPEILARLTAGGTPGQATTGGSGSESSSG